MLIVQIMNDGLGSSSCAEVTVAISIYRQPLQWIQEAVNSVRSQSFENWELFIRPDGPNAIAATCEKWLSDIMRVEPRISLFNSSVRLGTFGSYSLLFSQSEAKYLIQLDADDRLSIDAIRLSLTLLEKFPESPFFYSQCNLINEHSSKVGLDQRAMIKWHKNKDLVQFIPFHMRTIRHTSYIKVGGYDDSYKYTGDYDLSLRLAELGKPLHLPLPLYSYRVHHSSESQTKRLQTHNEAVRASRAALERRGIKVKYDLIHSPRLEKVSLVERFRGPLIIAGMHRCGTSLLALLLSKLGVSIGSELLEADRDNPDGYQEDLKFQEMQRQWFHTALASHPQGFRDWGWNPDHSVSRHGNSSWKAGAEALLRQREVNSVGTYWGWKDPRTTLILPFWQDLRPELRLIGIYRTPWDLSDALQRLDNPQFRINPDIILPLWSLYNERLAEHLETEAEKSILIHAESMATIPEVLIQLLRDRWGWNLVEMKRVIDMSTIVQNDRLVSISLPDPIEDIYSIVFPDLMETWYRLQRLADLPNRNAKTCRKRSRVNQKGSILDRLLTVVITTYNPSHLLLEAIASVERHSPKDNRVEILIVDDGSTNFISLQILDRLQEGGYRLLRQQNLGLSAARNLGIEFANTDLILPLDDDNRLLSPYLNEGLKYMIQHPEVDLLFGDRIDFGACHQHFRPGRLHQVQLLKSNRIDACAIIRRSLWIKCGGFDPKLKALEDWDLWLTGSRLGMETCYLTAPCFEYRVRENSLLRRHLTDVNAHHTTIDYLRTKHRLHVHSLLNDGY